MSHICGTPAKIPTWMKVTGACVLVEIAGMALAFCLGRPDIGVLAFQATPTTVLVGITYNYARSTAEMVKLTRDQLSFLETQAAEQKRAVFEEVLTELAEALITKTPPFKVSRWERYQGRLVHSPILTERDVGAIARAYLRLEHANAGLEPLSHEDETVIRAAADGLRRVLDKWDQSRAGTQRST